METVGIRELKRNLSAYLRSVKDGKKVVITDRKKSSSWFERALPTGPGKNLAECLTESSLKEKASPQQW